MALMALIYGFAKDFSRLLVGQARKILLLVIGSLIAIATVLNCSLLAQVDATMSAQLLNLPVSRVEVTAKNIQLGGDRPQLLDIINILPGQPYSPVRIREAIAKLYQSGRAAQVEVNATRVDNRVALTFTITRQLRLDRIEFTGNTIFSDLDLQSRLVGLEPGSKVSQPNIDRSADNLVRFYQDAGYFQAAISAQARSEADGRRAVIVFQINAGQPAQINEVILEGKVKIDVSKLLAGFQTQPTTFFNQASLQNDIETLRRQHIEEFYLDPKIDTPQIQYNEEENNITVRLIVDSGPLVNVGVSGLKIDEKKLRKNLPLLQQGGIDDFVIEEGRRRLLEFVQREGYFFAKITAEVQRLSTEVVNLTYQIEPKARYRVKRVQLEGSDTLTIGDLSDVLKSQTAIFPARGITSQEFIAQDRETIASKLKDLGYLQAQVLQCRLGVSPQNQDLVLTFVIEQGPRIFVDEVAFTGNKVLPDDLLRASLPIRNVAYLSNLRIKEDLDRLATVYNKEGYADVQLSAKVENLDETHVRVLFQVIEGEQVVVNRIVINNRGRAASGIIQKYLTFREGDLLQKAEMNNSEQRLYATGAFRSVQIHSEFISHNGDGKALHDVFVEASEAEANTLIYGFGYQSEDGPRGLLQISNVNLLGRLQTGTVTLRGSRREQLAQLSYIFPRPFGLPVNPLVSFFLRRREENSFTSRRLTALMQLERRLNKFSELIFRYSFENIKASDIKGDPQLNRADQPIRLGRLSTTYLRDTRNSILDATEGTFTTSDLSIAAKGLGGERDFVKFFGSHQRYRALNEKSNLILANSLQLGLARTLDNNQLLPLTERFFAGGASTLRGFGFERAGPRDLQNQTLGGNMLVVLNSELRFPLTRRLGSVVFYDTGNVFRRVEDFQLRRFSNSIGTGIRIATPVGPVRLDVGFLLNPRVPERRFQFHFSFGQAF
jgi:outer membrane protein insertion porin family